MKTIFLIIALSIIFFFSSCNQTEPSNKDINSAQSENQTESVVDTTSLANSVEDNNADFNPLEIYSLSNERYFYTDSGEK